MRKPVEPTVIRTFHVDGSGIEVSAGLAPRLPLWMGGIVEEKGMGRERWIRCLVADQIQSLIVDLDNATVSFGMETCFGYFQTAFLVKFFEASGTLSDIRVEIGLFVNGGRGEVRSSRFLFLDTWLILKSRLWRW